jgi:hypothetical protein
MGDEILLPLREKYLVRKVSSGGKTKPRTGNSNGIQKRKGATVKPPKRSYGPF